MNKTTEKLTAFILIIAMLLPVIATSASAIVSDPVTLSIDKYSYKSGESMEISWSIDSSRVDMNSVNLYFSTKNTVNGKDDAYDYEYWCVESDELSKGVQEGKTSVAVPASATGLGSVNIAYALKNGDGYLEYESCSFEVTGNTDYEDFITVSFNKPIDYWASGDTIKVTWDYNESVFKNGAELRIESFNENISISESDPGLCSFRIGDVTYFDFMLVAMGTVPASGNVPAHNVRYDICRDFCMNPPEEQPSTAPTATPTAKPADKPTDAAPTSTASAAPVKTPSAAPTRTPSTAPAATPTPAAKPSAAPTASAPTNDPTSTGEPGIPATPVELNLDEITIGAKQKVDTVFADAGTIISWKSANEKIAKVDAEGNITGVKKGKTTITVTGDDGSTDTVKVTVVAKDKGVKKIKLDKKKATLKQGEKLTLKAKLNPSNAKNKKVVWESSDTSVVTVDSKGKIKAIGIGNATITATASSGKVAECKITVTGAKVKKITIEGKKKMKVGESQQLLAKIKPDYAENKVLKWKSSNKKVATVDENGVVTAIKKGTVKITATATDGSKVKKVFVITIKKK